MSEQAEMVRRGRKATMARRTRRLGLVLALAAGSAVLIPGHAAALPTGFAKVGMVCTPGSVSGSTHTFSLVASTGYADTPDGNSIFMWGYANHDAPDSDHFQTPGPVLCVTEGETVVVNLTNTLPEAASIVFPGQTGVTAAGGSTGLLTAEAPAGGGTVSYSFTAGHPGTYLYQSGSDQAKQVEMGLYGALVVRPDAATCPPVAGTNCAYGASTRYDSGREYLLLLSEIDPVLHHAVEIGGGTYDLNALRPRYFTVNGRAFPDTLQDNGTALQPNQPYGALVRLQPNTAASTQPALIRMVNAGLLNHPFHPHGNHTTEIAQDGRVVPRTEHFGETIGSGQTLDYLIRWDDVDQWNPAGNPLPVAQPNYRNLTFKDGKTFYSGSPYLGYKGTLPTGTVSQNVCGEWYFPWHSHALKEFTNFDEGFGGMATLLRVDPGGWLLRLRDRHVDHRWHPQGRGPGGARRRRHGVLPGEPQDHHEADRDHSRAGHDHYRIGGRLPGQRELLHPHRQRGPAGHRRARHHHMDGGARATGDRGGCPRQRRRGDRAGERLVRDVHRAPCRCREPQGDLQGQELR
jgi:hypothetical protein